MHYLTIEEILVLHQGLIDASGGSHGVRDAGGLESAIAQPQFAFGGSELYPTLADKACALAFSLMKNHPFIDGNKRIGYAAMAVFVRMNAYRMVVEVDDAEQTVLQLAAGSMEREEFREWISRHLVEL
jgi:death-on-curing protein